MTCQVILGSRQSHALKQLQPPRCAMQAGWLARGGQCRSSRGARLEVCKRSRCLSRHESKSAAVHALVQSRAPCHKLLRDAISDQGASI